MPVQGAARKVQAAGRALAENQIKDYISALVASKITEAYCIFLSKHSNKSHVIVVLPSLLLEINLNAEREALASNSKTQINGLIAVHNLSNFPSDI